MIHIFTLFQMYVFNSSGVALSFDISYSQDYTRYAQESNLV